MADLYQEAWLEWSKNYTYDVNPVVYILIWVIIISIIGYLLYRALKKDK